MFDYLNIPPPDPDSVLETPDITTSTPSTFPSQAQPDTAHSTQPLQFPMPGLAMSLVQPDNHNSSQKFEANVHTQSDNALLQHAQAQYVHVPHPTHDPNSSNSLAQSRTFMQPQGQPHRSQLPPSQASSHSLPIPLRLPLPQTQQHMQSLQQTHLQWQPHQMPLGSPLLPSPPHYTPSRHLPVGDLLYNAPSMLPSNEIRHLPPVSEPSPSRERELQNGKRPRSMRRRQPIIPSDIPHRSPKTRAKRSLVWNFFQESKTNPNVAMCQLCQSSIPRGRKLARNTTNLRKHLEHRHPTELAEYTRKSGRATGLQSSGLAHGSPAQSQSMKNQISFPLIVPNSEPVPSSLNHINQLSNGHNPALGHDRHSLAASFSAANGCNGLEQDGSTDLSLRRSLEESSAVLQCGTERMNTGSHLNFNDHMTIPQQYRLNSAVTERTQFLDHHETDRGGKGNCPSGPGVTLSRLASQLGSGEERQTSILPGNSIPVSPMELNRGLLSFLATMDLPLAASKSKGFEALFSAARLHIPAISTLHTGMLQAQKRAMGGKIRNVLAEAEKIVIVIEATKTCKTILCRYFKRSLVFGHLCLEVIPWDDPFPEDGNETKASISDMFPSASGYAGTRITSGSERAQSLLRSVDKALDVWDIREKTTAVILSERILAAEASQFQLRRTPRKPSQSASVREESDSSRSSRQAALYLDNQKERTTIYNDSEMNCCPQERIPVLSCFVSIVETIVSDTICESELVKQHFIEPMSRGMFKVLSDRSFLLSEDFQSRPTNLKLPLNNLSMEAMLALLGYFIAHLEIIQAVLKRQGDTNDVDILCMQKGDLKFLEMLLVAFSESLRLIREVKQGAVFRSERISIALPAMKQLLQKVEALYQEVNEPLKRVVMNVFQEVKVHRDAMEAQDMYICATLLDPRFKRDYFTSKEVAAMAEGNIAETYERERRRHDQRRAPKENAGNLQNILLETAPSGLDHFMDPTPPLIADRTLLSTSLSSYLEEPTVEFAEDTEAYWREHQHKWPVLSEVATQYALTPSTCETDRVHSVLGDYRRVDSLNGNDSADTLSLAFLKNNLLLVEGNSMFN